MIPAQVLSANFGMPITPITDREIADFLRPAISDEPLRESLFGVDQAWR